MGNNKEIHSLLDNIGQWVIISPTKSQYESYSEKRRILAIILFPKRQIVWRHKYELYPTCVKYIGFIPGQNSSAYSCYLSSLPRLAQQQNYVLNDNGSTTNINKAITNNALEEL